MSGGMRQRVMIAMALVNDPELLIADEPTTALDVTVQAQIIDLLRDLQQEFGTAIVLITHDLGVVADMADEVVVMYGGRVVEHGSVEDVYYRPEMPYTWGLLSSVPRLDQAGGRLDPIAGSPPSLLRLPKGCVFRPRCVYHTLVPGHRCDVERPELLPTAPGHEVRCHIEPARRRVLALERVGAGADEVGTAGEPIATAGAETGVGASEAAGGAAGDAGQGGQP
jgi:peptide/nickel transport system ATP-binding protein